ncbi:MAG TPA: glycosyltransferase family 4 protein [Puia sp.]|nr:glycosyltransferase family 4 protein [Puia sp.]
MQVLHISGATSWRGGEQQLVNLYDALKKVGIKQTIYCPAKSALADYCTANRLSHYTFTKTGGFNIIAAFQLKKILRDNPDFSIVHLHDSDAHTIGYLSFLFGVKVSMVLSRKVVFKIKSSTFTKRKYNASCIKKIICVSEAVRKVVEEAVEDKSKLIVVYEGVKKPDPSTSKKFILPIEIENRKLDFLVGYIAALTPEKDHETFLQTAAALIKKGLRIGFVIAGTGKEKNNIEARIKELHLSENVFMIGFCENVPALMEKLNVLLFTSLQEGFPITILEAFFLKLPVVATDAGGITEMIDDSKTGFISEKGNAKQLSDNVEKILSNPSLRKSVRENAFEFVQQFNYDAMAKNILKIYTDI